MSPIDADGEDATETRHLVLAQRNEYTFQRFRLRVLSGHDVGKEESSTESEFGIGTSPGNHLVLTDITVSRHHCALTTTPHGVMIRDLGSKNGTLLSGYRIEAAYLKAGAIIDVGMTKLRFEPVAEIVREPISESDRWGRVLGHSAAMRRIFSIVEKLAETDSTVLLQGETGTGKGLLADAIHAASPRAKGPFVVVDCSAIAPTLIESELFGHDRGAFTGAHAARAGAFELAQKGTILLDEVGELPLALQPKLLRALEEREIKRVGSSEPTRLNVRVIAATNRDLRKEVNAGTFRPDLFFRLNTVTIAIPPLRERCEDIPVLTAHFYEQFTREAGAKPPPDLIEAFSKRDWPGNVRELRNAVERSAVLGSTGITMPPPADPGDSPVGVAPTATGKCFDPTLSFRATKERAITAWENAYLKELLAHAGTNISQAARDARTDRNYLRELLRKHGLTAGDD